MFMNDRTITLSRENLGADCKVVELKVIAVTKDKLPSEVAYKRYEIKEGLAPKKALNDEHVIIPAAYIEDNTVKINTDIFKSGGSSSV